ncbi:MAG TPA: plastocyanin/azurin family copper-binding protein [Acidimicrobiales bacterium]|nr:plastocyanin/azurin family copper-binding protein [Acidimicrobiales bacterium]
MRKISVLALAVLSASLLVGCSRQQPELVGSQTDGIPHNEVLISHMSFIPRVLTVQAGQTVTWVWDDGAIPHNVTFTSSNLTLASPSQATGTFRHTFDQPGIYMYRCTIHNNMLGEIIVK